MFYYSIASRDRLLPVFNFQLFWKQIFQQFPFKMQNKKIVSILNTKNKLKCVLYWKINNYMNQKEILHFIAKYLIQIMFLSTQMNTKSNNLGLR